MKIIKTVVFFIFVLAISYGQELDYNQFTTDDGLPSMTIYEIVQDSTGLLWIGTANGLVTFNGVKFITFTDSRLKDNDILELEISKDGHVTFTNDSKQYVRLEEGKVVVVDTEIKGHIVLASVKDHDYLLVTRTSRLDGSKIYEYSKGLDQKLEEGHLVFDIRDSILVSLFESKTNDNRDLSSEFEVRFIERVVVQDQSSINIFKHNRNNYILRDNEAFYLDSGLVNTLIVKENFDLLKFNYLLKVNSKTLVASKGGLGIFQDNSYKKFFSGKIEVNYIFVDTEGHIWLSTNSSGLLNLGKIDSYKKTLEVSDKIYNIKFYREYLLLVTRQKCYVFDYNMDFVDSYMLGGGVRKKIYIKDHGIYIFNNGALNNRFSFINGKLHEDNTLIGGIDSNGGVFSYSESENFLFLAMSTGVYKLEKEKLKYRIEKSDLIKVANVRYCNDILYNNYTGSLLIGSDRGLFICSPEFDDVLDENRIIGNQNINVITPDKEIIWVGTANRGIYKLKSNDTNIGKAFSVSCLPSMVIKDIVPYGGYLFIATSDGIVRYNLLDGACDVISEYEGLVERGVDQILIKSLDSIYIVQNKSFSLIDNQLFDVEYDEPTFLIGSTYINNEKIESIIDGSELDHTSNNIEVEYNFNIYRSTQSKAMQYRLNNDTSWTATSEMSLRLPSLGPGDYVIEAKGTYSINKETKPLITRFTILPPWWQTALARVLGAILMFLLVGGGFAVWTNRVKERELAKRKYLEQINQVKDQALQLQMNPHFIFNAMNAIQNFISNNSEGNAVKYLAKFARLIRMIFEYSKSNLISVEKEIEFVSLYIELELLRFKNRISVEYRIGDELEAEKDILKIPPLLVQPVIENSFKHGLFHKKGDGLIIVEYQLIDNQIRVVVEDNGVGREKSQNYKPQSDKFHNSSGITNTKERLDILNFKNSTEDNSIAIEDLYFNGQPSGTRTVINIDINENHAEKS